MHWPYNAPTFVVTHRPEPGHAFANGTTFTFVNGAVEAIQMAKAVAGDKDVNFGGGASVFQQILNAGLVDEIYLHVVPIFLGDGRRLFDGIDPNVKLIQIKAEQTPKVTHLSFAVSKESLIAQTDRW